MVYFDWFDCVVNMVGVVGFNIGSYGVVELFDEEWLYIININLNGVFYVICVEICVMRVNFGNLGGSIVNVVSIVGL